MEEARAIISDRNEPELKRRKIEVLLRYAERGRRASTSQANSRAKFARVGAILDEARSLTNDAIADELLPVGSDHE